MTPSSSEVAALEAAVLADPVAARLLEGLPRLGLPGWYLGAGAVAQAVWNRAHDRPAGDGVSDYDVVYFDADLAAAAEAHVAATIAPLVDGTVTLDVTNEARVHLWYRERFGVAIEPYRSTEDAIATWPTTASCVGVRMVDGTFDVCAPWGLADLLSLVVRPNPRCPTPSAWEAKWARWSTRWPLLRLAAPT